MREDDLTMMDKGKSNLTQGIQQFIILEIVRFKESSDSIHHEEPKEE